MKHCPLILPSLCINHSFDTFPHCIVLIHGVGMTAASNVLAPFPAQLLFEARRVRGLRCRVSAAAVSVILISFSEKITISLQMSSGRALGCLLRLSPAEGNVVNEERMFYITGIQRVVPIRSQIRSAERVEECLQCCDRKVMEFKTMQPMNMFVLTEHTL